MLTLATLALLAADPSMPPLVEAPSLAHAPREAKLLTDIEPTPTGTLVGRAVLAPVVGALGTGLGGLTGLLIGGAVGAALGGSWGTVLLAIAGAAIVAPFGLAFGIAAGAAMLGSKFGDLFRRSIPWAFLAAGLTVVAAFVALAVLPEAIALVTVGAAVASAVAVPLIVEARRMAEVQGPESTLALATF